MIFSEMMEDGRFQIKLFCVNPAVNLQIIWNRETVRFSFLQHCFRFITIKSCLVLRKMIMQCMHIVLFRRKIISFYWNGCKYPLYKKGESTYQRFARYIAVMAEQKKGNYMAFFPSYRFLEEVHTCFLECVDHEVDSICQVSYMDEEQRKSFGGI